MMFDQQVKNSSTFQVEWLIAIIATLILGHIRVKTDARKYVVFPLCASPSRYSLV